MIFVSLNIYKMRGAPVTTVLFLVFRDGSRAAPRDHYFLSPLPIRSITDSLHGSSHTYAAFCRFGRIICLAVGAERIRALATRTIRRNIDMFDKILLCVRDVLIKFFKCDKFPFFFHSNF